MIRVTRMVQLPATAAIQYVAAGWVSGPGDFCPGVLLSGGSFARGTFSPGVFCPAVTDKQTNRQKTKRQTQPRSSAGSRPPLPKFSGYVEVEVHYIFHPSTIWVRPLFTELGPKKAPKSRFCHEANEYMSP